MAISEKKKASNAKWDRANMATVACSLRKEQAAAFRAYCETQGMTSNTAIKAYVMSCLDSGGTCADGPQGGTGMAQRAGAVSLPAETEQAAQRAAEVTGETVAGFITRAVDTQAQRDKSSLRMGVNPATGERLNIGGAEHE